MNRINRSLGFTLLELVVAIAIFSIISTASAYFIRNVLAAQERSQDIASQMKSLQKVWLLLQQDIEQVAARPIRDEQDDPQPALIGEQQKLEFTRIGWPLLPPRELLANANSKTETTQESPRSEVLRVRYYLDDEQLMRAYWPIADRAPDAQPQTSVMLAKVKSFAVEYVFANSTSTATSGTAQQQTSDVWPPDPASNPDAPLLPSAIKITFEVERYGELYRWFQILNQAPVSTGSLAGPGTKPSAQPSARPGGP